MTATLTPDAPQPAPVPGPRPPKSRGARRRAASIFEPALVADGDRSPRSASLNPRTMMRNPVMFIVEIGSALTTILFVRDLGSSTTQENVFAALVAVWLWFTVLFANFAEAMAEGRGKAQADTLRTTRSETTAARASARRLDRGAPVVAPAGRRPRASWPPAR